MPKVLAITSGGGHWDEMMVLRQDFDGSDIVYANTFPGLAESSGITRSYLIKDCNRDTPLSIVMCLKDVYKVIRRERPDVIISTGAAPGLIAVIIGYVLGIKTVWVDSVANSMELSLSGRVAGKLADVWLTQWQHLSRPGGPRYWGSIL